jgi:ubiquinone/menaquinone biosynthesis C-methylase UbiE
MGGKSISFDRIADRYDETRGGLRRGREVAEDVAPHLADGSRVLEVGVGTGAVAVALTEMGREVVGIDLSSNMLSVARSRVGSRVACADAHAMPFGDAQFPSIYIVWVLHLVADPQRVLTECARVLRAGGRLVIAAGRAKPHPAGRTDITEILTPLERLLLDERLNTDDVESVQSWARAAGLETIALLHREERFESSPAEVVQPIEDRAYSYLWRVDDQTWADTVQPVIDRLRALPDQDRKRPFRQTQPLHVFTR